MQESSMGTADANYNPDIGESAWIGGMTKAAKAELERNGIAVDLDTQAGVIDAIAAYLNLKRTVLNPGAKTPVEYKDPVNLYVQRYKTAAGLKLSKEQEQRFRDYLSYYAQGS